MKLETNYTKLRLALHELNNKLAIIRLSSSSLVVHARDEDDARLLRSILAAVNQAGALSQQILACLPEKTIDLAGIVKESTSSPPSIAPRIGSSSEHLDETNSSGRILLIEDEGALRSVVAKILALRGYSVLEARSGMHAVQLAEIASFEIDLLIADIRLPDLSGIEVAKRICGHNPAIRVIFCSGGDAKLNADADQEWAHIPIVLKPYDPQALISAVRNALGE